MTQSANDDFAGRGPTWFGQPAGLTILFLTEMWEKFSYYGMRVLLVYYMVGHLQLPQTKASLVYGIYTGLAYLTPIFGGLIADRWLGRRRAVLIGGTIMAAGHFMMTFEALFYPALATIAIGNGLFLPSLPGQVGELYAHDDPRRRSAYNVYYVGINLGGLLAPLVCGTVGELYGWHYGFGLAGVGMLIGLVIYSAGGRWIGPHPRHQGPEQGAAQADQRTFRALLPLLAAVGIAVVFLRSAYEQVGNTIALWTADQVDRSVGGQMSIPMTWFQALNPLLIFLLTPLLVRLWTGQGRRGTEPGDGAKMAIGSAGMAIAFFILSVADASAAGGKVSWLWLAAFVAILTAAELWVLPVGLGLFARLAPSHLAATAVAGWFLTSFGGNLLAGVIGTLWGTMPHWTFFMLLGSGLGMLAFVFLALNGPLRRAEAAV